MASFEAVRKQGTLGAALTAVGIGFTILPSGQAFLFPLALIGIAGVYLLFFAIRDTAWVLQNSAIVRYFIIGEILTYAGAIGVEAIAAVGTIATRGSQELLVTAPFEIAFYVFSILWSFFLAKSLLLIADGSGIPAFRYATWAYIASALIPSIGGQSLLNDGRLLVLAFSFGLIAVGFNSKPLELQPELPIPRAPLFVPEAAEMATGLPIGEKYLGSVSSPWMNRKGSGYAIYATDRRLFGVHKGGFRMELSLAMGRPQEVRMDVARLERKHDFVMTKDEVSSIKVVKPGIFSGHLVITPKKGKEVSIKFRGLRELELMTVLMRAFDADAML